MQMINLDYICMEIGQKISEDKDKNIFQKALGILQEDGVYAMFLWLENKDGKSIRVMLTKMFNREGLKKYFLSSTDKFSEGEFVDFCKDLQKVAVNINKLFFMKKLLERTLIYALYHAKAREEQ